MQRFRIPFLTAAVFASAWLGAVLWAPAAKSSPARTPAVKRSTANHR
jgi:hypothetical protein